MMGKAYYHMIKTLGLSKQKGPKRKYNTYEFIEQQRSDYEKHI